ncbi:T-complex protein 11-domain-containing protein [Phlebopus sp. FC_14]|nr:T-complex protein 11-domain-containing protein [Phlebopus sp. FC_14]
MGDLGHPLHPVNCRKRKADGEEDCHHSIAQDSPVPTSDILVDGPTTPHRLSHAPRQPPTSPWLSTDTATAVWPSEASPTDTPPVSPLHPTDTAQELSLRFHKRPRVDTTDFTQSKRHISSRGSLSPHIRRPPRRRPEHRDSAPSPPPRLPLPHSVLRDDGHLPIADSSCLAFHAPFAHIDLSSPHIPPLHPLINRQTLQELDLGSILRNPQLRHDLLFDAGLQFRPTSGRRKREVSDRYWSAIAQELENGCTCVSFNVQGRPCERVCVCRRIALPIQSPVLTYSTSRLTFTLRMPSRIRPLLTEFLEVLLFVIQPLTSISDTYANPSTFQAQMERHAAQAAHLRSVFDPELIQQEMQHDLFDPSGLFVVIGETLKSHCAPMRDRAVDAMVEVAKTCAPGGSGNKADAVKAVRLCFDILEVMKLDIANHQLQTLRPFLIDNSGQYELKAFKGRKGLCSSLDVTRQWMLSSHQHLLASPSITHPSFSSGSIDYASLSKTQKTYISVLKGLTDLVFDPPSPESSAGPSSSSTMCSLPSYPETSYLDSARLLALATEAAEAVVIYMFILLYRQLVFSDTAHPTALRDQSRINDAELVKLKKEIRDISSSRLGHYFKHGQSEQSSTDTEHGKWHKIQQDIVLQVALRAKEAQVGATSGRLSLSDGDARHVNVPDERILKLAERWSYTHMRPNSSLSTMLKKRVRDAVFSQVVALTFPPRDPFLGQVKVGEAGPPSTSPSTTTLASGMEPLADELRALAERLSRLAHVHLGVYLPLYEQEDILSDVTTSFS